MRLPSWMVLFLSLGLCLLAQAGQLHISYYGLNEVRRDGQTVAVGKLVSAAPKGRTQSITVAVTRLFTPPGATTNLRVGESVTRELYGGIEWTDPHKSPIDDRLRAGLGGPAVLGTLVVLVPSQRSGCELLPASEENLRTLELLYDADPAGRIRRDSDDRLRRDLGNPDLAELAQAELARRGKLSAVALLGGDAERLHAYYRKLSPSGKSAFVQELLPHTKTDRALRKQAAHVILSELQREILAPAAQLTGQLDWSDADERRELDSVRIALLSLQGREGQKGALDLSPFGDFLAESTLRRPDYRSSDDELQKLLQRCDRSTQARLAVRFLAAVHTSSQARGDDPDGFVLRTAVDLARLAPSAALWEPLQKLDPSRPRVTSTKEFLLGAMLEIGVALAKHDPSYKAKVRDLLEPHMNALSVEDDKKRAYRAVIGELPRSAPRAAILALRPGERRRLASGELISIKAEPGASVVVIDQPDGSSEERSLDANCDAYREWYLPPYVVVVQRVGQTLTLRFTPATRDPAMDPAAAYDLAKAICDRRGITGEGVQDPQDYDGLYTYEIKGGARPCKIRIGTRTRRVLP